MSERSDRELLDAITLDLEPVRPAPRLALAASAVFGIALLLLAEVFSRVGRGALVDQVLSRPDFAAVAAGLLAAGVAGTLAGLSGAAPDRAHRSGRGVVIAASSIGLALLVCLVVAWTRSGAARLAFDAHAGCFVRSALTGLAPGAVLLFCCLRGWVGQPRLAAAGALLGALSIGALAVHLGCPKLEASHLMFGHLATPVVVSALALAPLSALLRRFAR